MISRNKLINKFTENIVQLFELRKIFKDEYKIFKKFKLDNKEKNKL